jgi:hypothetical protein
MSNITAEIKGEGKKATLVISIPVDKKLSKSQKNMLIASTGGNQTLDLKVDGKNVVLGLNAYIPA